MVTPLNTVDEIKRLLLLETENQTLLDDDILEYLKDAHEEMISSINRSEQADWFYANKDDFLDNDDDEQIFTLFFRASSVNRVRIDGEEVAVSRWELIEDNQRIKVNDLDHKDFIEVFYVPINFKYYERSIAMVNLLSRLSPFSGEQVNPAYAEWRQKKKAFKEDIDKNVGVASHP